MNNLRDEQIEVLKALYPSYKAEVYRRREQMMKLTAFACSFLVLLLITMLTAPGSDRPAFTTVLFASTGVALFSSLFAYLVLQQRDRHRMAKEALIEIERLLGLYDEGLFLQGKSLYPENWQTDWQADRSVTVYLAMLMTLTVLVIAAVLLRM
ncbi:MAG: hypothetical protein ACKOBZ_07860 [Nitrospira sp.]|nr:hypothetical protein [Nitrospira sp.]